MLHRSAGEIPRRLEGVDVLAENVVDGVGDGRRRTEGRHNE